MLFENDYDSSIEDKKQMSEEEFYKKQQKEFYESSNISDFGVDDDTEMHIRMEQDDVINIKSDKENYSKSVDEILENEVDRKTLDEILEKVMPRYQEEKGQTEERNRSKNNSNEYAR